MSIDLPWLSFDPHTPFPPPESALREPDGLLAAGGDLSVPRLLNAYRHGIFPWFSEGEPILWWSPDPRMVLRTDGLHLSARFRRQLRHGRWVLRADSAFDDVILACATIPRPGQRGTWITPDVQAAYRQMHRMGHAHSVETFDGERLVGGIYGVAIGRMFYGESMFSLESGASKAALAGLARFLGRQGWPLIDAQVESAHLRSLGAESMPRDDFIRMVARQIRQPSPPVSWRERFGERPAQDLADGG